MDEHVDKLDYYTKSETPPYNSPISEKNLTKNKSFGRWMKEEHTKFIDAIKLFGKNWKKVEDHVGTRSGA